MREGREEPMHSPRLRVAIQAIIFVFSLALFWITPGWAQIGGDDEKIEEGAKLYAENCAVCHGVNGQGRVGATLAKDWPSIRPDLRIKATIARGVPGSPMPAWSQDNGGPLTEAQIDMLVSYILTWESGESILIPPTPTVIPRAALTAPPDVSGDPNSGALLYDQNCLVCHGPDGQGRIGATLAKDWPSIRPDLRIKATIDSGVPGSPMPAWSQDNGGPLTEVEINDLVAFILTWSTPPNPPTVTPAAAPTEPGRTATLERQQVWVLLFIVGAVLVLGAALVASRRKG